MKIENIRRRRRHGPRSSAAGSALADVHDTLAPPGNPTPTTSQSVSGGADLQIPGSGTVSVRGAAYDFQCSEAKATARREQRAGRYLLLIVALLEGGGRPRPLPRRRRDREFDASAARPGNPVACAPFLGGLRLPRERRSIASEFAFLQGREPDAAIHCPCACGHCHDCRGRWR